jgi:hypothetical protein
MRKKTAKAPAQKKIFIHNIFILHITIIIAHRPLP